MHGVSMTENELAPPQSFDLSAMKAMAAKVEALQEWMPQHLEQGVNKDWEYAHNIWRREAPRNKADWKPALLDPGTFKIMAFMGLRTKHTIIEKVIDLETKNIRYVIAAEIVPYQPIMWVNPITGEVQTIYPPVAEGLGSCTTREKKYRVRWTWQRHADLITIEGFRPNELEQYAKQYPDRFEERPDDRKGHLYYMADGESLGLDNTLLKMACKRAEMDAVFQLPGVAQRFSQEIDVDGQDKKHQPAKPATAAPAEKGGRKVIDFMYKDRLQVPETDIRDELNRAEESWAEAESIAAQWLMAAGMAPDKFNIKADGVKLTVKPNELIPQAIRKEVNDIFSAHGFALSRGAWRLNKQEVAGQ